MVVKYSVGQKIYIDGFGKEVFVVTSIGMSLFSGKDSHREYTVRALNNKHRTGIITQYLMTPVITVIEHGGNVWY